MNEAAFPNPHLRDGSGMTIRDVYAGLAMQGLMHNYHPCDFLEHKGWLEDISMASYQMADAMLQAREA